MANVKFLRGTEANLRPYLWTYDGASAKAAEDGTFYLTSDTNRLYVGKQGSGGLRAYPVGQGVIPVDTAAGLPAPAEALPGQFYYVVSNNILCIATGSENDNQIHWVQINPDTNTDNYIVERTVTPSNNNNVVEIVDVLYNKDNVSRIQNTSTIQGAEGFLATAVPHYKRAAEGNALTSVTYYTLSGTTYTEASPRPTYISAAGTAYYVQDGYSITLTPTIYSLSSSAANDVATITLTDNATTPHTSTVTLASGDNVHITKTGNNLVISADDTAVQSVTGSANATSGFNISVTDSQSTKTGTIDPAIKLKSTDASSIKFENGVATLDVYTTAEVDEKFQLFNAMEYKGAAASLPTGNIANGWTYMATGNFQASGVETNSGDLLIAQGPETVTVSGDPQKYIDPDDLTWTVVKGYTVDQSITFSELQNGFILNQSSAQIMSFAIAANTSAAANTPNYLTVSQEPTAGGRTKVVRISHNETNPSTTTSTTGTEPGRTASGGSTVMQEGEEFKIYIPIVSYDAAGHITGIVKHEYTIVDTHATLAQQLSATASNDAVARTSTAVITEHITSDGTNIGDTSINLTSSTINFTASSNNVVMNIEWGSFDV